jgi:hypothetical protein
MDDLLNKSAPKPEPVTGTVAELREELESLRHLAISIMVLVLILAGTFDLFLLRQVKNFNQELSVVRPQAEQLISDFQKYRVPAMDNFLRQIVAYGQTHPDFGPILASYNLKPTTGPGAITPAPGVTSAPMPAPAPATKK